MLVAIPLLSTALCSNWAKLHIIRKHLLEVRR